MTKGQEIFAFVGLGVFVLWLVQKTKQDTSTLFSNSK